MHWMLYIRGFAEGEMLLWHCCGGAANGKGVLPALWSGAKDCMQHVSLVLQEPEAFPWLCASLYFLFPKLEVKHASGNVASASDSAAEGLGPEDTVILNVPSTGLTHSSGPYTSQRPSPSTPAVLQQRHTPIPTALLYWKGNNFTNASCTQDATLAQRPGSACSAQLLYSQSSPNFDLPEETQRNMSASCRGTVVPVCKLAVLTASQPPQGGPHHGSPQPCTHALCLSHS